MDAIQALMDLLQYVAMTDTVRPPKGVREAADLGLRLRQEQPPSNRAGTPVGLARARDLANGRPVSYATLKRMKAYFDRHEVDKQASGWRPGEEGYPSKGYQAWLLWGGDPGQRWVLSELRQAGLVDKDGVTL
jgi:hypothetical protein